MIDIKLENFERERLDEIFDDVTPYSQMDTNEKYFLNGAIRYFKPKNILEVGIANGGGSAIILNAIKDLDSRLTSVDYCEKFYGSDIDKPSGYIVDEKFSYLKKDNWKVYLGGDISKFIEQIGGGTKFDFLVLDTAHIHPWETLNFLCVLPFMNQNSWVVLHDISLPLLSTRENDLACRYLFSNVVSEEKLTPAVSDIDLYFPNIGAFKITGDTRKYIGNLFESLVIEWQALPFVYDKNIFPDYFEILEKDLNDIRKVIKKYYPERSEFFENTIRIQKVFARYKNEVYKNWRTVLKRNFPYIVKPVRAVRALRKKLIGC